MGIDRRNFFKALGVTGATLALGRDLKAAPVHESDVELYGVLYDSNRCVGCQNCEYSCAEANHLPAPVDSPEVGILRKTDEKRRTVLNVYDTSNGEVYIKRQCMHCNEPACTAACLTQAMHKSKKGPVTWRGEKCMGCRYCMVSCPFDIPKFEYNSPNPKITKCDMCHDRVQKGKLPACVENCASEALVFGKRRDLIKEARKRIAEYPDLYIDQIYGENEAGGTGFLYLSPVPFEQLGMNTRVQNESYPGLSKGFLYSVPAVFVLWPAILLGIHEATKKDHKNTEEHE